MFKNGKRNLTAEVALKLERYFGSEAQGWLNLQDMILKIKSASGCSLPKNDACITE
jgi:plasmid maintenance system antidote protein VapI